MNGFSVQSYCNGRVNCRKIHTITDHTDLVKIINGKYGLINISFFLVMTLI